jgi:hypothetical protein
MFAGGAGCSRAGTTAVAMGSVTRDRLELFLFRNNVGGERVRGRWPTSYIVQWPSRNGKQMGVFGEFIEA